MAELKRTELSVRQERAILVGVILPKSTADPRDPLGELASLAKTAGARVVGTVLQKRARVDPGKYVGSGKAVEIAHLAMKENADVVIFDNDLSPGQIGGLEKIINEEAQSPPLEGIKVIDRSELILDIFATRARTYEAKLQVELAQLQYTYPRLTRMWGHLERIASGAGGGMGIGTRGPGETQLETDRRLVRDRISDLRREIRTIQDRKSRLVEKRTREHFTVCIVGYTNAGKSTLFNTLTAAGTYADDKLFATLDTKTRAWKLDRGVEVLLSDTVGFVRDLPHNLVASFRATLEEAVHADLLLHVLDVGHPHAQQQFDSVHEVLAEIGCATTQSTKSEIRNPKQIRNPKSRIQNEVKPEILLLNKIDIEAGEENYPFWRALIDGAIPISAKTGAGMDKLIESVLAHARGQQMHVTLEADVTNGRVLAYIEHHADVRERRFTDGRVEIDAIVSKQLLAELSRKGEVEIKSAAEV